MKSIILAVAVLAILVGNVNAAETPTAKGVYSLSGDISYNRASGGNGTMTSINPAFMYFVYPNLAIGTSISYWDFKTDNDESKSYGIGPVIRYYFGNEVIYPFISLQYVYTQTKYESNFSGLSFNSKGHGDDVSIGLGADYFLAKNVAIEPIVRYTFSHNSNDTSSFGSTSSSSNRHEALFIGIGINVFIF